MRLLTMLLSLYLVGLGIKMSIVDYNELGAIIMVLGAVSFLLLDSKRKRA